MQEFDTELTDLIKQENETIELIQSEKLTISTMASNIEKEEVGVGLDMSVEGGLRRVESIRLKKLALARLKANLGLYKEKLSGIKYYKDVSIQRMINVNRARLHTLKIIGPGELRVMKQCSILIDAASIQ